ncbi:MAG: hypothetical protein EBS87_12445, partial [Sphingomonadaceae bacterium]|nr:hypothetical protein [Sphingomonadaceae bacterium]
MRFLSGLSPRATGLLAAVVTVAIWTSFIVIARASAQFSLGPYDIAFARILGASAVLLPVGWWMVRQQRAAGTLAPGGGWLGLSPLAFRISAVCGFFGGLMYAVLAYAGFFHAPAAHASVLMPGSLPLWTTLLAALILKDRITPARAAGLACILAGDLLVGGASLLSAFDGGDVWKGDLLFMAAAFCWSTYSVLARRHALGAVEATIAITLFALITYVPGYLQSNRMPSYATNCIEDWEQKVDAIVTETLKEDMRLISGIPSWVLMYFERLLQRSGKKNIREIFPHFSLFVYGGVQFAPYRKKFIEMMGCEIPSIELYPASEGFIAFQDHPEADGL